MARMPATNLVVGVAIAVGALQFVGSLLWAWGGAGIYGSPLAGGGPWAKTMWLFLVTGPMALLPAAIAAIWFPRTAGLCLIAAACVSAWAAIGVMRPGEATWSPRTMRVEEESTTQAAASVSRPDEADLQEARAAERARYTLRWALTLIVPFSLPACAFGTWLCLDARAARRRRE